jgi:hypothetical protein
MANAESHWLTGSVEQRRVQTSKGRVEYADVGLYSLPQARVGALPHLGSASGWCLTRSTFG